MVKDKTSMNSCDRIKIGLGLLILPSRKSYLKESQPYKINTLQEKIKCQGQDETHTPHVKYILSAMK